MSTTLATVTRDLIANAITAVLNTGKLRFETAANALVANPTLNATAFGASSSGVSTANAIADDTNAAGGTIDHMVMRKSDATPMMTLNCGLSGSGAAMICSSLGIGAGETVQVTAFTITVPAS